MERSQGSDRARMTRRELGRLAAGSVAGALAASAVSGVGAAAAQEPPKSEIDTRLALIEKSRGGPLPEEQRRAVLKSIQSTEEAWARGRQFPVPDGTEPNFLFRPTPSKGRAPSAGRRAPTGGRTSG